MRLHLLKQAPRQQSSDDSSPWARAAPRRKKPDEFDPSRLEINRDLTAVRHLLPGSDSKGHLLQSLKQLEHYFHRHLQGEMQIQANNMFDRLRQINSPVPHRMTPFLVENTFSSIEEAAIQFAAHSSMSHHEQEQQLDLWSERLHFGLIYNVDGIVVAALKFRDFRKVASFDGESTFRLPEYSKLVMEYHSHRPDKSGNKFARKLRDFVAGAPLADFLHADAYIIVTNKAAREMVNGKIMKATAAGLLVLGRARLLSKTLFV